MSVAKHRPKFWKEFPRTEEETDLNDKPYIEIFSYIHYIVNLLEKLLQANVNF